MVVRMLLWPISCWTVRTSVPALSMWVANECLSVWHEMLLGKRRGMEMMSSPPAGRWIRRLSGRWEDELPRQFVAGGRTLAVHGVRQLAPPSASFPVHPMSPTHLVQMPFQWSHHAVGEQSESILSTFSLPDGQPLVLQANVFDA